MAVKPTTIVTIEQARDWVLDDPADTARDSLLELLANAASERLERDTSRIFKSRACTDTARGQRGASALYLRFFPVISVASFAIDGVAVDSTFYQLDAQRGRLLMLNGRTLSDGEITVTYTAGYADADLPSDAVELALSLTKRLYHLKTKGGQSFETASIGGHSFVIRDSLPKDWQESVKHLSDKRFG